MLSMMGMILRADAKGEGRKVLTGLYEERARTTNYDRASAGVARMMNIWAKYNIWAVQTLCVAQE